MAAALEAGGVGLQVCPVFVELERQPEGALREALDRQRACFALYATTPAASSRYGRPPTSTRSSAAERIGLMLSLEGVEQFGYETWPAETFWELGVRMAGLTWNRRNPFADGAAEQGGLSRLGRELVDGSSSSGSSSTWPTPPPGHLRRDPRRVGDAPLLCSHADAARSTSIHALDDEQMRELAARGGLLGLMLHPLAIGHESRTLDG